jgi:hypothetical protein
MLKDGQPLCISVDCYAGYRGEETPLRFRLGDRLIEIAEVVDCWLAPDHRYFKARTSRCASSGMTRQPECELTLFEAHKKFPTGRSGEVTMSRPQACVKANRRAIIAA